MPNPLDEFYTVKVTPSDDVKSPCVRNCCLDNEDVCLGCNRTLDEILAWGNASREEKKQIIENSTRRSASKDVLISTAI
ncbi:DUF1289 domain-containing protein [Alteromonadaceae bacterium M269]|nr:DUF1289 domain-containing protein [Alteromonadaceae bacterium M269]